MGGCLLRTWLHTAWLPRSYTLSALQLQKLMHSYLWLVHLFVLPHSTFFQLRKSCFINPRRRTTSGKPQKAHVCIAVIALPGCVQDTDYALLRQQKYRRKECSQMNKSTLLLVNYDSKKPS